MDMWKAPVVQSRQPLTYSLMEAWAWEAQDDMESADREGFQRMEALGYQPSWWTYLEIWCEISHVCSKPATCTWKGGHWCGYCPSTCILIKNPMITMMMRELPIGMPSFRWWFWQQFRIICVTRCLPISPKTKGTHGTLNTINLVYVDTQNNKIGYNDDLTGI